MACSLNVGWIERDRPEVRCPRIQDERPQHVLRLFDRRLGDDHALLVAGHLGLRLHDVDGRHRPDFDALPVVLERLLRKSERLLLRLQVVDGVGEIPVRVLHVPHRLRDDGLELDVGEVARLPAVGDLLPDLVDGVIAQQRLRDADVQRGVELRAEAAEQVRGGGARAVPVRRIVAAPAHRLADTDRRRERAVVDAGGAARERARRLLRLRGPRYRRREARRPGGTGQRDADVLNLRVHPLDPNAEVLLERERRRFVDRKAADRLHGLLSRGVGRSRLDGANEPQLSGLAERGQRRRRGDKDKRGRGGGQSGAVNRLLQTHCWRLHAKRKGPERGSDQ